MTEEEVRSILSKIKYPGYARSIIEFKMVKSIEIDGEEVKILLNIATKNEDVKRRILEDVKMAFKNSGVKLILNTTQDQPGSTVEQKHLVKDAKKRIAILSAKGGVGKTTVAVSLAIGLKKRGYKVGILDADVHGPNVPRMLGTLGEKASVGEDKKLVPVFKDGLYSMSLGYVVSEGTPVIWKGAMVTKAIVEMLELTNWPSLDYFIVDLPPGTGDAALTIKQNLDLDEAIIVTTPGELSIADAIRTVDFFKQVGVTISGFIENMTYFVCDNCKNKLYPFGKVNASDLENILGIPSLGEIPFDTEIEKNADDGTLVNADDKEYFGIIDKIIDKL